MFLFLVLIGVPVITGSQSTDDKIDAILYILESPKSQLIPVNRNVVFTCQAYCDMKCAIEWIVNNSVTANFYHRAGLESKGFSFSDQEHFNKIYTVRLTINSSISVNDTDLHCNVFFEGTMVHDRVTSNHAKLFVITEPPILPNPTISIQNNYSTSFLLQWSPPYLWPGHHIQYYNINITIITNVNDSYSASFSAFDTINATFSDALVSYIYPVDFDQNQMCTEILFDLSAITKCGDLLSTSDIKGEYPAIPGEFLNSSIDISVLFTTSLTPLVNLNIELPGPICIFQELNYTITVTDTNDSIVSEHGPYHQLGSGLNIAGIVHHDVSLGLLRDQEYYLTVTLATISYVTTSDSYYFDTNFEGDLARQACGFDDDAHLIQLITGISLGIFLLFSLALLVVLLTCIIPKKQKCCGKNSQNRMFQSMVHNPIYSGPEYESIHPQYESMKLVPQQQVGEFPPGPCDQTSTPSTEKPCHFDQPLNPIDIQFPSSLVSCFSP